MLCERDAVIDYCLLASLNSQCFTRPCVFDLSKAPESYYEAISRPDADVWKAAMQRELTSLEDRHAFERTTLPHGRKAIGLLLERKKLDLSLKGSVNSLTIVVQPMLLWQK